MPVHGATLSALSACRTAVENAWMDSAVCEIFSKQAGILVSILSSFIYSIYKAKRLENCKN